MGYGSIISTNAICRKTVIRVKGKSRNLLDVSDNKVQIVLYIPKMPKRGSIIACIIENKSALRVI